MAQGILTERDVAGGGCKFKRKIAVKHTYTQAKTKTKENKQMEPQELNKVDGLRVYFNAFPLIFVWRGFFSGSFFAHVVGSVGTSPVEQLQPKQTLKFYSMKSGLVH